MVVWDGSLAFYIRVMRRELLDAGRDLQLLEPSLSDRAVMAGRRLDVISTAGFPISEDELQEIYAPMRELFRAYETAIGRWRLVDQWFSGDPEKRKTIALKLWDRIRPDLDND
jgi:hypothetical protein